MAKSETSIVYIPHGAGPLPLLGDNHHSNLVSFLKQLGGDLPTPDAIIAVSAHFEEPTSTVTATAQPTMLYDYYGFPPESYEFNYPAPGDPRLAHDVRDVLNSAGIPVAADDNRGFDHGTFVPLMIMYPDANIPIVQLSLTQDLDAAHHLAIGKALGALEQKNLLVLGSGMSFHNMTAFKMKTEESKNNSRLFHEWLVETLTKGGLSNMDRELRLADWARAPQARFAHPREEHLLPLHVCTGLALSLGKTANIVFDQELLGHHTLGVSWV